MGKFDSAMCPKLGKFQDEIYEIANMFRILKSAISNLTEMVQSWRRAGRICLLEMLDWS